MANSENDSCLSLEACGQKGTYVDFKRKLRKDEISFRNEQKKIRFVFVDVTEGDPLHQSGIRDGDELTTVNNAEVKSFHGIDHIASAIRDCKSAIILGMRRRSRRRRRLGSVPFVVLFQLGEEDANPVHKFCGFYWNVSPRDIPFITSCCKQGGLITPPCCKLERNQQRCMDHSSVEVFTMEDNIPYWLTFNSSRKEWAFERGRTTLQLSVCPPEGLTGGDTTVAFRVQLAHGESGALEATSDNELKTSRYIHGEEGQFFKIAVLQGLPEGIQSSVTKWYLQKDEDGKAVLSPNVAPIFLYDTNLGE